MTGHVSPREYRTEAEAQAAQWREGLIAYESNYDLPNVLSLSREAQRVYWMLKEGGAEQSVVE